MAPAAALDVLRILLRIGEPTVILRRGRQTGPSPLEQELAEMCHTAHLPVEWRVPAPGGRDEIYFRDIDMVASADLVIAVFPPDQAMTGGTDHVIQKAIDQRVPAYAFAFEDGLRRVGEHDPDDIWAGYMPGAGVAPM